MVCPIRGDAQAHKEMAGTSLAIVEGNFRDVKKAFTVLYNQAEADRLGRVTIGGETEINNRRVQVVGITRGAKSFM